MNPPADTGTRTDTGTDTDTRPVVVLHQDDIAMCHGANAAFFELTALGTITSGSVMVPCPWFREIAEAGAEDPSLDLGVHLTLCAEKPHYRWGPLTRPGASGGLTDPDGYFWHRVAQVREHAHPEAVEAEFRAQIDRALAAGMDVTHLDAHMGVALAPEFCEIYVRLGAEYRLPVLLSRRLGDYAPNNHLDGVGEDTYAPFVAQAEAAGMFIFDRVLETNWSREIPAMELYEDLLGGPHPASTFVCLHPNTSGELEFIEPRSAYIRIGEYELFRSDEWWTWLDSQPFRLMGMRGLRAQMRSAG